MPIPPLSLPYSISQATIEGYPASERWLSALSGSFYDEQAYQAALHAGDRLVYRVANVETASGEGQLHYALGMLMPGKVGSEYYLTRGHIHAYRPAAEVYICLSGKGLMLLEEAGSGECQAVDLTPERVVYVPGNTAHRTVNIGDAPLIYWGVLSAAAGHDYDYVREHNFSKIVLEINGRPTVVDRHKFSHLQVQ